MDVKDIINLLRAMDKADLDESLEEREYGKNGGEQMAKLTEAALAVADGVRVVDDSHAMMVVFGRARPDIQRFVLSMLGPEDLASSSKIKVPILDYTPAKNGTAFVPSRVRISPELLKVVLTLCTKTASTEGVQLFTGRDYPMRVYLDRADISIYIAPRILDANEEPDNSPSDTVAAKRAYWDSLILDKDYLNWRDEILTSGK